VTARSKKDLASDELEQALSHVGKALTLLGGRTRALSVKSNQRVFTVRKYLESIEQRLRVCQDLLQLSAAPEGRMLAASASEGWVLTPQMRAQQLQDESNEQDQPEGPRDDFEKDYDSNRAPGC
jgi:hypothetical protein